MTTDNAKLTKAEENLAVVRAMFSGISDSTTNYSGYLEGSYNSAIHPDIEYYGHGPRGEIEIMIGKESHDNVNRICRRYMDEGASDDELVGCWPAGEEMVVTHIRLRRRATVTGEVASYDCVVLYRVEDGMITKGVDLVDKKCEEFWARTISAS
ncbi:MULTISPECIES: nuclear transport factor 2 family protein [unclassified Frankia]|uniref:nuclear transport factor 2 family protein n=1 Tax=unclassified Frankia TaxID=2632575 RepID=UPI002AD34556|nr:MULTISPECIES: nuclear transport factor 2 family protein [unclassified Frankia]